MTYNPFRSSERGTDLPFTTTNIRESCPTNHPNHIMKPAIGVAKLEVNVNLRGRPQTASHV